VVRTRTDVALYVLNHKRGHLRDLENSFKVSLAIVADPTVAGQQSFIIDRGEQVHTLEAAKALLAAQAAASVPYVEEPFDDEEGFDLETEGEVETEETEGLAEEAAGGEEASGEGDGQRRKRRRRRRGRGEGREGAPREDNGAPRDDNDAMRVAADAMEGVAAEDGESDEDEGDEQPGVARGEQGQNGERRPRRRGRRGGRRRRGYGPEDGLAGSISDELGPTSAPEAATAVADFDGGSHEPAPTLVHSEPAAEPAAFQPAPYAAPEPAPAPAVEEAPQDERAAGRRRSTVREKVSFATSTPAEPAPAAVSAPEPVAAPASAEPAPAATNDEATPRKAGWWSRRFGSGE